MNEELVKKVIQYKLKAVSNIIDKLPGNMSNDVKSFGKIVLESLNENFQEIKDQPENKIKSKNVVSSIKID